MEMLNILSLDNVIINWWLKYIVKNNKTDSRYIWRNLNNFQFWTQLAEKKKEKKKGIERQSIMPSI